MNTPTPKSAVLTLLVVMEAVAGKGDELKAESLKMLAPTRAEDGCMSYNFYQSNTNANTYVFHETWASYEHWQVHMQKPHLLAYLAAAKELVAKQQFLELSSAEYYEGQCFELG